MRLKAGGVVVAFVAATAITAPVTAQIAVGAKGGSSRTSFTGSSLEGADWISGFMGGVFLTYPLVQELAFHTEALYVQKGARLGGRAPGPTDRSLRLGYLEVPVMLRIDLPLRSTALSLHGMAGPTVAVNVHCEVNTSRGSTRDCAGPGLNLDVRTFDWSMVSAGGIGVDLGAATLVAEARLSIGLGTIDAANADLERTNQAFGVMAGIAVPLGERRPVAQR